MGIGKTKFKKSCSNNIRVVENFIVEIDKIASIDHLNAKKQMKNLFFNNSNIT